MTTEKQDIQHVPRSYQTYIKAGDTRPESDHRQLLRVDDYLDFAGTDYVNHDPDDIGAYIQHCIVERENARGYVQQQFFFIRKFFDWLVPKERDENPADYIDTEHYFGKGNPPAKKEQQTPDEEDTIYYFEPEEVDELIANAPFPAARSRFLIKLMHTTGPRAKEVKRLRWDDIDEDKRVVTYITAKKRGKTDPRDVPYPATLDRYLQNWKRKQRTRLGGDDPKYVFTGRERDENDELRPISVRTINEDTVKQAVENADLQETLYVDANGRERKKYTSHALRHSYAVAFVEAGGDIKSLKDLLGHTSTEITERYLQFKTSTLLDIGRKYGPK
ncbi:tyrosine-type recombinase/integrase [Halosimplex halobium]|uniref:tyrosine-type recombinase/integrase n=1 Tax=Halosimplex halobium TaxID=3396618 RepID=UPI003F5447A4